MFDLAISFVPFFFLIKHKLYFSLCNPSEPPACALRSSLPNHFAKLVIFSEICKCFFLSKRLLPPYSSLFRLLPKYLRFFLQISLIFRTFAPLITISGQNYINYSYSFPKQNHYATKPVFNYGPH